MKKLLLVITLFLLALILNPNHIYAQGEFSCTYLGPRQGCVWANANCDPGYEPTNSYCNQFTNIDDCNNAQATSCVSGAGTQCRAVDGNCTIIRYGRCPDGERSLGDLDCPSGETCCAPVVTDCVVQGGECRRILRNICPDRYDPTPIGSWGGLGCGSGEACCIPASAGCVAWNPITNCPGGTTRCPGAQTRCCPNVSDCPVFDPGWGSGGGVGSSGGGGGNALCPDGVSINTAIGCIPVANTNAFASFFIGWGIRIAGGIAFLLIVFAGFQITTSGGDPKKLQAGRELLTSAIAGLLLLIFSAFILRLVGVDILGLPQFGG